MSITTEQGPPSTQPAEGVAGAPQAQAVGLRKHSAPRTHELPGLSYADLPSDPPVPAPTAGKRVLDLVGASLILLLLLPLLSVVWLAVALTSKGPVFYRQRRVGRHGDGFEMWKFRSMRVDAEAVLAANPAMKLRWEENDFKLPEGEDPRITPVGRFLRRTSLDEFPQLFNVLLGEMSLVGPRPVRFEELPRYQERVHVYTAVRPGMTGLWQVSGRSNIGFPQRADIDEEYVRSVSVPTDLLLLLKTVPAVLRGDGAH